MDILKRERWPFSPIILNFRERRRPLKLPIQNLRQMNIPLHSSNKIFTNSWAQWGIQEKYKTIAKGFNKLMEDQCMFYKETDILGEYQGSSWFPISCFLVPIRNKLLGSGVQKEDLVSVLTMSWVNTYNVLEFYELRPRNKCTSLYFNDLLASYSLAQDLMAVK